MLFSKRQPLLVGQEPMEAGVAGNILCCLHLLSYHDECLVPGVTARIADSDVYSVSSGNAQGHTERVYPS